jgi:hypothetical protein
MPAEAPISRSRQALRWLEGALAVGLAALLLLSSPFRQVVVTCARADGHALLALPGLLAADFGPTLRGLLLALLRLACLLVPIIVFARRAPRHRLAWLPLLAIAFIVVLPISLWALNSPRMWAAGLVVAALATWLVRHRWLRWCVVLPLALVVLEPGSSHHSRWARRVWPESRLAPRCAANDGVHVRPASASPDRLGFFAVTPVGRQMLLLTGEGHSFWLRQQDDGTLAYAHLSNARGNLWRGCQLGEESWFTNRHRFHRIRYRDEGGGAEEVEVIDAPASLRDPREGDYLTSACDSQRGVVYFTELMRGGLWKMETRDRKLSRDIVGGILGRASVRRDGRVALATTARLATWDPEARRIAATTPAALAAAGSARCAQDDAMVVTDLAGRLRYFEPVGDGYAFRWGIDLAAPRWAVFSPDCRHIATTSANDRNVYVVDRERRAVVCTFAVGPGLRDLTYLGPRRLVVTDACGATVLDCPGS